MLQVHIFEESGMHLCLSYLFLCVFQILLSVPLFDDIDCCDGANIERKEIEQMVRCRMASLGLPSEEYGMFLFVIFSNFDLKRMVHFYC